MRTSLHVPENLLQLYVENSPLALIQFGTDLRITAWSERATAMFGWTEDEVRGKTLDEFRFVHEDDRADVAALFVELANGPVTWKAHTNRNRRRDGELVWCRWFSAYLASDRFSGFVSLAEDITETTRAREAASASEERLRALFDATPDALTFFDAHGKITDSNPASERIMGVSRAELNARPFTDFILPGDLAFAAELFARAQTETVAATLTVKRLDGSTLPVEFVAGPLHEDGAVTGVYCSARDITERNEALAHIEASEERFRSIFDNNPDPMIAFDADGTVTRANAAAGRVLEIDPESLVGKTLGDIATDGDLAAALACFNRALAGMAGGIELHVRHAREHSLPAFVTMIPIRFRGRAAGVDLHVRDLRAAIAQRRQIAAHAERIRDLYVSAAAANENAEQQIKATIESGCRILGVSAGALYESGRDRASESYGEPLGPGLARLALGSERSVAIDDLRGLPGLADEPDAAPFVAFIGTPIDVSGARYGCLCFADRRRRRTPFDDVDRDLVQLMGALVSSAIERGRSRARLQTLAYSDTVTALPNRAWLVDHLRTLLEEARRTETSVGVLFLDLDRFKDINDTLGHHSGDRLLRIVGERLEHAIRTDDVVARMGGDEFVVLAGGSPDMEALGGLAERIIATVEEPIQVDSLELFVTTSIGIASFPADGGDAETLVKHADVAMYRAKDRGRNTYQFFTPALNATLHTRLSQEKSLRKALDNGEFVVYYQPQHDLVTGNLTAVEALVRWNHPRSGLVLPGQFIPNAELSGLIVALGDFILETACTDISALRKTIAPNLRLAVNLSARQFHQQRLAAKVRGYVERTGLDPTALELEITESVAMNDAALTVSIMRDIGAEGMSLAVDDFGTGYSSLGYLRRFPLDSIKIDRSFVTDLAHEPDDATIVRTVIAMAHSLDLEVIAEGVETAQQLAFLRAERCDRVQGFYFSQAVPLASPRVLHYPWNGSDRRRVRGSVETVSLSLDRAALVDRFRAGRARSAALFASIAPTAYYEAPIPLRHPFVFYDGHLPAFAFLVLHERALHGAPIDERLEKLFERGIDPSSIDAANRHRRNDWPDRGDVRRFAEACEAAVIDDIAHATLDDPSNPLLVGAEALFTILEHEPMHHETLAYIINRLPLEAKHGLPIAVRDVVPKPRDPIAIAAGSATLGRRRGEGFGWDNEFDLHTVDVPAFGIDAYDVTNGDYLAFVRAGGAPPSFWFERDGMWWLSATYEAIPLPLSWPVYVSHDAAEAFATWSGARLPTEAEYHRAAFGTPAGEERAFPWGSHAPAAQHGNFDFRRFDPEPVGSSPAGASAWGVEDLVGNGWEWTSTPFAPFDGFVPMASYPQYSADFFDGRHYVMKGASPVTSTSLIRRSFRNWFFADYPYMYATFRRVYPRRRPAS